MSLIHELRRRNVFRVAAGYVVTAWLLIQVAETVFPLFGFGDEPARITVVVLVVLFLPTLVLAWVFEWTPEGLRRESEIDPEQPVDPRLGRRFDRVVMVVLTLAVAYFAVDKFVLAPSVVAPTEPATATASADEDVGPPMVAVLPFTATSLEGDSGFFADGVHEDLLTRLARLQSLRVISRSSVEAYREGERNLLEIGEALGADAILEGRIQSAGGRIRINVQLIDPGMDSPLWAETYDRELTPASIFEVQGEIAKAIADSLKATLSADDQSRLALLPTENMGAYRAFHTAMKIRHQGTRLWNNADYQDALEEAVELDPGFTQAWAQLAGHYSFINFFSMVDPAATDRAQEIVDRVGQLAPGSPDHLLAQAYFTYYVLKDFDLARRIIDEAIALSPSDQLLYEIRSWIQRRQADFEGQLENRRALRTLDPGNPRWTSALIGTLMLMHRYDEAAAEIEQAGFTTFGMALLENVLRFREHQDTGRYADDFEAIRREFSEQERTEDQFHLEILARRYDRAEALSMQLPPDRAPPFALSTARSLEIILLWLRGDPEGKLPAMVDELRPALLARQNADGTLKHFGVNLDLALFSAVTGDRETTEMLVRRFQRAGQVEDPAWLWSGMAYVISCRLLGMAGAAEPATECFREGLRRPSSLMAFSEIHEPFYDPIRGDLAFERLMADVGYEAGADGLPVRVRAPAAAMSGSAGD